MTDGKDAIKYALVVIDLQRDLCLDERRRDLVATALPAIFTLVDAWRRRRLPVYFTRFELPEDDPQFDRFGGRYCVAGTEGAEFIVAYGYCWGGKVVAAAGSQPDSPFSAVSSVHPA